MKKREMSIRFALLRAYCIIVVLMSVCFLIGIQVIRENIEHSIQRNTEEQTRISQNILDAELNNACSYGMQLFFDATIKRMEKVDLEVLSNRDDAFLTSIDMNNYITTNPIIEDLYLYYPASDYIVGSQGVYPIDTYGALLHIQNKEVDADKWKESILQRDIGFFVTVNNHQPELFFRLAPTASSGRILVIKFNIEEIQSVLHLIGGTQPNSFIAIVDQDNRIYSYAGDYDQFANRETNLLSAVDASKYLCTDLPSSETSLRYVTITGVNDAYQMAQMAGQVSTICVLFSVAGALLLSFYFTKRNMEPVIRLIERYGRKSKRHKNELKELEFQLEDLMCENQNALVFIEQNKRSHVVQTFLNECLKLSIQNQQTVANLAAIYDLSFENSNYIMVVQKRTPNYHSIDIITLLEQWDNDSVAIYWTHQDGLDVFLINYDYTEENAKPYEEFLLQLQSSTGNMGRIAISKQTNNLEEIQNCWLDCLAQFGNGLALIAAQSVDGKLSLHGQIIYNSFVKYLENEEYTSAINLVPELYSHYLDCGTELEKRCKQYRIIQQLLYLHNTYQYERYLQTLADTPLQEQWKGTLRNALLQIKHIRQTEKLSAEENTVAARIREFLDAEYSNTGLDLKMVSEYIGLSESYISRIFKEEYGLGVSQYVNWLRIDRAKQLLQTDTLSIKAIALQVGYASDAHFIRMFKKMIGKTPGAFRSQSGVADE